MFEIKNISVKVDGKKIVDKVTISIDDNETHVIMGPNGAGKSTLAKALLAHPAMKIEGNIILNGKNLTELKSDERARAGLFLAFQNPEEIEGINVSNLIRKSGETCKKTLESMVKDREELEKNAASLGLGKEFVKRDLNVGFSGGEKKRMEMLQAMALKPNVVILDEVDSGLDVDGVRIISETIEKMKDGKRCFLLITHYPRMLRYMKADRVHIMVNGRIVASGDKKLADEIEEKGYTQWVNVK